MLGAAISFIEKELMSLLLGDASLSSTLEGAFDKIGEEIIDSFLPTGLGREIINRYNPEELGKEFIQEHLRPKPIPHAGAIANSLQNILAGQPTDRRGGAQWRQAQWRAGGWAASRQEWLAEKWRHDWRSQPRDADGRWVPGRLDYNAAPMWRTSARQRRVKRFRRVFRKAGRESIRGYYSSWGRTDGR